MASTSSVSSKLFAVGALILVLLIPVGYVTALVSERERRRDDAVREIQNSWSTRQAVMGPILQVPVRTVETLDSGATRTRLTTATFLPESLDVTGGLSTELRYRGIYRTPVYTADLDVSGRFAPPSSDRLDLRGGEPLWDEASILVGLTDLRGIKQAAFFELAGRKLELEPGVGPGTFGPVLRTQVPPGLLRSGSDLSFGLSLALKGSESLHVVPLGKTTTVALSSGWPSPSFRGDFLPDRREVGKGGFSADWRVLHFNRPFPQEWLGERDDLRRSAFGVELKSLLDQYGTTLRAAKYAVLFIFLTFLAFFFVEFQTEKRLHVMHFLLIGSAVVLFFLLLLSLSEHLAFRWAYLASAGAVVALIGGYTWGVFGRLALSLAVSAGLSGLYGFLYTLLRLEDYALLLGTLGLFTALAAIMYLTRRVDWHGLELAPPAKV